MPEGTSNSLVNLGDLSKPADTLIIKISDAVGGLFAPLQVKRMAKAEAEAALIKAESELKITDLHRRAMHRFVEEEAKKQENMENITRSALPELNQDSKAEDIENDWITNFFDKSRIVSDKEMQELWARVLAGEANAPGKFSKRTVNLLAGLDKKDAELFQSLCRFGWIFGSFTPLVFEPEDKIYADVGINFSSLKHLDSIGLIHFDNVTGFVKYRLPNIFAVTYYGQHLVLTTGGDENKKLPTGKILLTKAGQDLASVCNVSGIDGYYDYVKEKWKDFLHESMKTEPAGTSNAGNRPSLGDSSASEPPSAPDPRG